MYWLTTTTSWWSAVAYREGQGQLTVYTALALDGEDGRLVGVAYLTDEVKADAFEVLEELRRRGYEVYMLTGDAATTARSVGAQLGFEEEESRVRARMKPEDKAEAVRELQLGGRCVAMVGDGVNDSLAMAQADVSVSFAAGTDLARSTADVVLLKDRLTDMCAALSIARETMRTIRVNIAWAVVYNVVAMPVAAGFLYPLFGIAVPPAVAGFAEFFSSIPVILYSLWLRRYRPPTVARPSQLFSR